MMRRIGTVVWLFFLSTQFVLAQGTKLWLQSRYDEFEKGRTESVAIANDGHLEVAPELRSVLLTPSTYIWSAASDHAGTVYLGTGSPATVLKVSSQGASTKLFSTKDLSVQAVQVTSDGSVYAATLPSGKVYRIPPGKTDLDESSATVVFDPATVSTKPEERPKYIWALAFDRQGALYIATGGPAAIYRVSAPATGSKPELFFSSDEQHIRCMLFLPDGQLIAGSDGTGLVYKIDKQGKGIVLYDSPKREITALAAGASGQIYVATVGEKTKSTLPPLPVNAHAGGLTATITIVTPGSVQASSSNSMVPEGSEVDELNAQGAPRKLWASRDDVVYALVSLPQGLLTATGNRGRIYSIQEDGSYLDLAHASAGQVTGFAPAPDGMYALTSNTGQVYKLGASPAASGTYLSDVFDAGFFSQWGRAEVNAANGGDGSFDLFARTGNIESPERNWTDWQKIAAGSPAAASVSARFIQWKAVLRPGARITSVGINYLPVNVAPVVDEIAVQPGARVNQSAVQPQQPQTMVINLPSAQAAAASFNQDANTGPLAAFKDPAATTVRWAAHDDNGDELLFDVYFQGDAEKNWNLVRARIRDRYLTFDSSLLPDGGYRLKVVASDAPSHSPGEALTGDKESDHFVIDTTPPVISGVQAKIENGRIHASWQATDATSPISRAEYSIDAGRWQYIEPVGKLSDTRAEQYDFTIPLPPRPPNTPSAADPAEHVLTLRVYDRYDNVGIGKTLVH